MILEQIQIRTEMLRCPLQRFNYSALDGTATAVCGFCCAWIKIYVWSLAGSGKRCTCGALLTNGGTFKPIKLIVREIFDGLE
jgi:hypothetical protein